MKPCTRFDDSAPKRPAVLMGKDVINYERFRADITVMAAWLAGQGLDTGKRVGILVHHPYWRWICHLAALRLGLTHATLSKRLLEKQVPMVRPDVMLGEAGDLKFQGAPSRTIVFSPTGLTPLSQQLGIATPQDVDPQAETHARRIAFTTGTTGQSKAVMWDFDIIQKRMSLLNESQIISSGTRLLTRLEITTTAGFRYPLAVWQSGGCVLMDTPATDISGIVVPIPLSNLLVLSPYILKSLLSKLPDEWQGKEKRTIIVAGGNLPMAVRNEALKRVCMRVQIAYGSTETGSVAAGPARLLARHPGTVGFVLDGVSVQVIDDTGKPLPAGQEGILRMQTPYMVKGYETPDGLVTGDTFRDGWFYPGDRGILFEDKMLAITGRTTDILNIGGVKISAASIETDLMKLPWIEDVCALAVQRKTGTCLGLVVVCTDGTDPANLAEKIRVHIPPQVQFQLMQAPRISRNAMGKIDRLDMSARISEFQTINI